MKIFYSIVLLGVLGMVSCRKDNKDVDIKQYDENQIKAYIDANKLTGMQKASDTSGIYYQILSQGTGADITDTARVLYAFSMKSLDGRYVSADTIINHGYNYAGLLTPPGLRLAIKNLAKTKGTRARFLIPSRLEYGVSGFGSGDSRLPGNESIDYYVNIINNSDAYDDYLIKNFLAANNLTGYTKTSTGIYYKITQPGTGTDAIINTSTVYVQYTGRLLNGPYLNQYIFDQYNDQNDANTGTPFNLDGVIACWQEILPKAKAGAKLSFFAPAKQGYGFNEQRNSTTGTLQIPAGSVLHFEMNIMSVTN